MGLFPLERGAAEIFRRGESFCLVFFGEVPGGWLQKEEKEESFREETRGRRLLRGDFEATGERVREVSLLVLSTLEEN